MMFYLFAGYYYYPDGGAVDFQGKYSSLEEARVAGRRSLVGYGFDWWHVTDEDMTILDCNEEI